MSIILSIIGIVIFLFCIVVFRGSPYVPSHRVNVARAFSELYEMSGRDVLLDVGSGDGVILREASKRGAKAYGIELNPILVFISKLICRNDPKIQINLSDFWLTKFPDDVTIVYIFSVTRDVKKFLKKIQNESNRLNRSLYLINYGESFKYIKPEKSLGAHHLYLIKPLQSR